ncbi:SURF1 family protein [Planktotalea sp.]|uniref:SURF1 family protein n=1 Tax=Planktotalea sp. TaxID=2029877 RepID=UPI0025E784E1|nr:SURF1 family protein [Planktotalea sp.]
MLTRYLVPLLFGLIGVAILVSLGVWQMQRLTWKQAILADIDARIAAEPVELPDEFDRLTDRFLPVTAKGAVTSEEIHVLVSQKQVGPGYRIISTFETDTGRRILLDRGFVKIDQKNADRPTGMANVTGNLHWPDETGSSIPEPDLKAEIWFARDVPAMAKHLETEPVMIVLRTSSFENDPVAPLPVDKVGIPNDHLQYAITWFSLAVIWLIMTLTFLWRARTAQKDI